MIARAWILGAVALLGLPSGADAALGTWSLSDDGQPRIDRSLLNDPPELLVCPPGEACRAVTAPVVYEPGETPAGTTFELRGTATDRSPVWQGTIGPQAPPAVDGSAIEGGVVQPVAGEWSGGWADDLSALSLSICRTAEGEDCRHLPLAGATGFVPISLGGPASLPAGSAGGYLFAVDTRVANDRSFMPVPPLYSPDRRVELPLPGARTMVSLPFGPVAPAGGAPPTTQQTPAAQPSATLRRRAYRSRGRVVVGTITCAARCRVGLTVGALRRELTVQGKRRLEIVRGKRLERGLYKVRVRVDGALLTAARVRLR